MNVSFKENNFDSPLLVKLGFYRIKLITFLFIVFLLAFYVLMNNKGALSEAIRDPMPWILYFMLLSGNIIIKPLISNFEDYLGINLIKQKIIEPDDIKGENVKEPRIYSIFDTSKENANDYYDELAKLLKNRLGNKIWNYYAGIVVGIIVLVIEAVFVIINDQKDGTLIHFYTPYAIEDKIVLIFGIFIMDWYILIILSLVASIFAYIFFTWDLGNLLSGKQTSNVSINPLNYVRKKKNEDNHLEGKEVPLNYENYDTFKESITPLVGLMIDSLLRLFIPIIILFIGIVMFIVLNPLGLQNKDVSVALILIFLLICLTIPMAYVAPQLTVARILRIAKTKRLDEISVLVIEDEKNIIDMIKDKNKETSKEELERVNKELEILQRMYKNLEEKSTMPTNIEQHVRLLLGLVLTGITAIIPYVLNIVESSLKIH